jgi:hypothetical protein
MTFASTALQPLLEFLAAADGTKAKEAWEKGPTVPFRGQQNVPIADYIKWLKNVDASPKLAGEPAKKIVQRMRRLYFSSSTKDVKGEASSKSDELLDDVTDYTKPPLTTDLVDAATLNGLYGTQSVQTPRGVTFDPSHWWLPADLALNGTRGATAAKALVLDTNLEALLTWCGDLGGAVNDWANLFSSIEFGELPELPRNTPANVRDQRLLGHIGEHASKGDLIGDMDGVILARHWKNLGTFVISAEVQKYYADDSKPQGQAGALDYPNSARRFHHFFKVASPSLPGSGKSSTPLAVTVVHADLAEKLASILIDAVDDILALGTLGSTLSGETRINHAGRASFDKLCDHLATFFETGLRTGDAAWPPAAL